MLSVVAAPVAVDGLALQAGLALAVLAAVALTGVGAGSKETQHFTCFLFSKSTVVRSSQGLQAQSLPQ